MTTQALRPLAFGLLLAAAGAAQDRITVQRLQGPDITGGFAGVAPDGGLQVRTGTTITTVPQAEAVSVTFSDTPAPAAAGTIRFDLAGGDRVFGQVDRGNFDEVTVSTFAAGTVKLLLDHLTAVLWNNARKDALLPEAQGDRDDELFLDAGSRLDRLPGELLRIERGGVVFKSSAVAERLFNWTSDHVVAVRLARAEPPADPEGLVCVARFRDGSRLTGILGGDAEGTPRLRLALGPEVVPDRRALQSFEFRNAAFRFLSDLDPVEVKETPFHEGGPLFGVARDRGFDRDEAVRIGGATFRKGLVLHARTEASWDLQKRFTSFTASVGVDPVTRERAIPGSARLRVLADGEKVWEGPLLVAGEEPRAVELTKLEKVSRLTVVADFGESGPTGARVVLGDAMLRRGG